MVRRVVPGRLSLVLALLSERTTEQRSAIVFRLGYDGVESGVVVVVNAMLLLLLLPMTMMGLSVRCRHVVRDWRRKRDA